VELTSILGLIFVALAVGLIIVFATAGRVRTGRTLREIQAFTRLRKALGLAVESGMRMHVSLGRGDLTGLEAGSALMGLAMQERMARAASVSDRPPVATSGSGSIGILSRDTFAAAYRSLGAESQFDPNSGRVVGLTPFSYAAGALPVIHDEQVSANLIAGHIGSEVALLNEAAERSGSLTVAGTDDITGQAVLYGTAQEPLIGEELYAGGAYLGAGPVHEASLRAQDVLRILVIALILLASLIYLLGLDQAIANLAQGLVP
jgi:hypothetical protein